MSRRNEDQTRKGRSSSNLQTVPFFKPELAVLRATVFCAAPDLQTLRNRTGGGTPTTPTSRKFHVENVLIPPWQTFKPFGAHSFAQAKPKGVSTGVRFRDIADQRDGLQSHPIVGRALAHSWCGCQIVPSKGSPVVGPITQRVRRGLCVATRPYFWRGVGCAVLVRSLMHIPSENSSHYSSSFAMSSCIGGSFCG